jgi:hypothetical protein
MTGKTQKQKFKDLAREAECEDDEKAFDRKLKRITKPKAVKRSKKKATEQSAD